MFLLYQNLKFGLLLSNGYGSFKAADVRLIVHSHIRDGIDSPAFRDIPLLLAISSRHSADHRTAVQLELVMKFIETTRLSHPFLS